MPTTKKTTPKRAGKTQRLDETPSSPVLVEAVITTKAKELAKAKMGRPTLYSEEMAAKICARLSFGESLRKICRDEDMPEGTTVWRWLAIHKDFSEQYARAKEESADALADDIQNIADRTLEGHYEPQASRVAIDAYKWTASKLKPKKYGDKLDLTSDGKQMPAPIISIAAVPHNKEINS